MPARPTASPPRVTVERVGYQDLEIDLPPAPSTNLSVHLYGNCTVSWAPGDRLLNKSPRRGQMTLVPRGRSGLLRVEGSPCEIVKVGIPETVLHDGAPDQGPPVLLDRFGADDPLVFRLVHALLGAQGRAEDRMYQDALTGALVAHLVRSHSEDDRPGRDERRVRELSPRCARVAVEFMRSNLGSDIGLDEMARELHLSTSHFAAQFRQTFGMPPARYMTALRLERARELVEAGRLPMAVISRRTGFRSPSHFSQAFRHAFGRTPTQWRAQAR